MASVLRAENSRFQLRAIFSGIPPQIRHNERMANKRRLIFVVSAGMLLIGLAFLATRRADEPAYEGRDFSSWLEQYCRNQTTNSAHPSYQEVRANRAQAETAIRRINTNAIPILMKMIRTRDP